MTTMRKLIQIVEDASSPAGFEDEGSGLLRFSCPTGKGVISANFEDRVCAIYEFASKGRGQGFGRRTLQWLRQHFDVIDAVDPGEEGTESRLFWEKMQAEGLVRNLLDEDFEIIG